jgi:hypothetical protein
MYIFVEIVIPEKVYQIERSVFDGCTSLDNVHVPSNITKMEQSVFKQCTSLTQVKFNAKIITLPKKRSWTVLHLNVLILQA